jgi:hypothetical protein
VSKRWSDDTAYPLLTGLDAGARFMTTDPGESPGEQQRLVEWATVRALALLQPIEEHAGSHELGPITDLGAVVRITDAGTVTLPDGFPDGWWADVVNATDADVVDLAAASTLVLPAGCAPEVEARRMVRVLHVGAGVWEAHGFLVLGS